MVPGSTTELIWHFVGYLHLAKTIATSRIEYEEWSYKAKVQDYRIDVDGSFLPAQPLPEIESTSVRVEMGIDTAKLPQARWSSGPDLMFVPRASGCDPLPLDEKIDNPLDPGIKFASSDHSIPQPANMAPTEFLASYKVAYEEGGQSLVAVAAQATVTRDADTYIEDPDLVQGLRHAPSSDAISDMLADAKEVVPDLLLKPDESTEHWLDKVTSHDRTLSSGKAQAESIESGIYIDGKKYDDAPHKQDIESHVPTMLARDESGEPGQVAESGANKLQNIGQILDMNEGVTSLIVKGDFYATNAIYQANILQDRDLIIDGDSDPTVHNGGNEVTNVATIAIEGMVKQALGGRPGGDLKIHVDYVDGDLIDTKALTQRNFIEDGDVLSQTRFDSYGEVVTGRGDQENIARLEDWGKQYDIIIVMGDYHSANIISQVNIIYDNDVIGISSPAGGSGSVFSGQNFLKNEGYITNSGSNRFSDTDCRIDHLINDLSDRTDFDRNIWSDFGGIATGRLNVLFVTGDYYDVNVISQLNVISDADVAIQMAGDGTRAGTQWLSTGANMALNQAEIVNAAGTHDQYLGGELYEDSILIQANFISEAIHNPQADPSALISEVIAFTGSNHDMQLSDGITTWTKSLFNSHDSFGHVLT